MRPLGAMPGTRSSVGAGAGYSWGLTAGTGTPWLRGKGTRPCWAAPGHGASWLSPASSLRPVSRRLQLCPVAPKGPETLEQQGRLGDVRPLLPRPVRGMQGHTAPPPPGAGSMGSSNASRLPSLILNHRECCYPLVGRLRPCSPSLCKQWEATSLAPGNEGPAERRFMALGSHGRF